MIKPINVFTEDIVGSVFDSWEVIKLLGVDKGHTRLMCKCTKCGKTKEVRATLLVNNPSSVRCNNCSDFGSEYEKIVKSVLDSIDDLHYDREVMFDNLEAKKPLRIDFVVTTNDSRLFAIEYNGKQHVNDVHNYDGAKETIKICYCYNHNIVIIIIPPTKKSYHEISIILFAFLKLFKCIETEDDVPNDVLNEIADYIVLPTDFDKSTISEDMFLKISNGKATTKFRENKKSMDTYHHDKRFFKK